MNIIATTMPEDDRTASSDPEGELQMNDEMDQLLSVDFKLHLLAGCFYSYKDQKLLIMEEFQTEDPEIQLEKMILELRPGKVMVSGSVDKRILDKLEADAEAMSYQLLLKPSADFNDAKSRFGSLFVRFAMAEFASQVLRGAVVALVKYVESLLLINGSREELENLICNVELFILEDYMYIDQDSMDALQVFPSSVATINTESKASLSELISFTCSEAGRKKLQSWILRPLAKKDLIEERLRAVKVLLHEDNAEIVISLRSSMRKVPSLRSIMALLRTGKWTHNTWLRLHKFITSGCELFYTARELTRTICEVKFLDSMLLELSIDDLSALKTLLDETLDADLTRDLRKPTILDGVDSSLDEFRKNYNEMDQVLREIALRLGRGLPENLSSLLNVAYIPQLGYLIQIESISELENFAVNSQWIEIFRDPSVIFYKNSDMDQMDAYYGDTYSLMCDCEIEIVQDLSSAVLEHLEVLNNFLECFATLDCFLSLAKAAHVFNYTCPEITEDNVISIQDSRHPIYEHLVPSFIPNDIHLGDTEEQRIMLITGANLSGKSIYLSQVGLTVFLAHIGSFVPAERARIGVCDRLLTRMISRETLSNRNSTFITDIQQMEKCLRLMTPKSLLLIDEFGKGTDTNDGPALLGSILKYLSHLNSDCPRSFTATHFHELFTDNAIKEYLDLQNTVFCHMDIVMNCNNLGSSPDENSEEISYLFRMKNGIANKSFGIYCAQICGISKKIIKRAQMFVNLLENGENVLNFCNQLTEEEARSLELLEGAIREFLMWDLDNSDMYETEVQEKLTHIFATLDDK